MAKGDPFGISRANTTSSSSTSTSTGSILPPARSFPSARPSAPHGGNQAQVRDTGHRHGRPGDDDGHDAIRDAIGRDFISVVASEEQITDYLDRLFGPASEGCGRFGKRP